MSSQEEDDNSVDSLSASFMKVYNNLPLEERDQTVVVIKDEPISWKMALREIEQETNLGEKILKKLRELDII